MKPNPHSPTTKMEKLTCPKHSRILIGKDKCVDCENDALIKNRFIKIGKIILVIILYPIILLIWTAFWLFYRIFVMD